MDSPKSADEANLRCLYGLFHLLSPKEIREVYEKEHKIFSRTKKRLQEISSASPTDGWSSYLWSSFVYITSFGFGASTSTSMSNEVVPNDLTMSFIMV